ncbi:MAG: FMN-binding protein [Lachnospira sp.]|nr:FMN-binding protein [Lachnospira sp.]
MKKRGTAGLLGGALAVVLLAGNVLGGSYPAYAQDTQYHDGNYTASAHVEFHEVVNYDLYVTVSVKDGVISKVALNDEKNADIEAVNVPYINYAMKGMADSYIGTTGTAADTVSGATYSANAINEAVAKAMVKSQANEADADTADTPSGDNGQNDNQNGSDNTNDTQKPSDDKTNSGDTGNDSYERVLKTGAYELTADSYNASAMMKMPAFICIDAENNTFSVHPYKNGVVDYATNKGSGSISFDSAIGVYTMTYEAGVTVVALGSTTTFTVSDKGITFTSPLRYGAAQMNTTDADGNFLSYTAVPYTQEIPDGDTNDDTQGKGDSGNASGGTSNDSTQSGESTGNSASESSANASEQDSGSTQSGAQTSGNSTVETGDAAMTGIYAVSAVVSIGLLIAAAVLKKRKRVL